MYFTICVDPAKSDTMTSETNRSVSIIVVRLMLNDKNHAMAADISRDQNSIKVFHCSIASSLLALLDWFGVSSSLLELWTLVEALNFSLNDDFLLLSSTERSIFSLT